MSAGVGEASDYLFALADELFDVIVKIWKRGADFDHVLFEFLDAIHGGADGAAEDDVRRNEFFESRQAPGIPEFGVISADQGFVVRQNGILSLMVSLPRSALNRQFGRYQLGQVSNR